MKLNRYRMGKFCSPNSSFAAIVIAIAALAFGAGLRAPRLYAASPAPSGIIHPSSSAISRSGGHSAHSSRATLPSSSLRSSSLHPSALRSAQLVYAHLPLVFEANQGQTNPQVKYLAHGSNYGLFLTGQGAVLTLHAADKTSAVRMELAGSNADATMSGVDELPGKSNYIIGNDPAKWHRNIPLFSRVRYANVYPGIDLLFYGKQGQLEYDFQVASGADPAKISLDFSGSNPLQLTNAGDLALNTPAGKVLLHAPRVYQEVGRAQQTVAARFVLRDEKVGFALGAYDHNRTLVIDPIISYSTYLGGSGDEACSTISGTGVPIPGCPAIAVDPAENIYIAGSTTSTDFPTTSTPLQAALAGTANVFMTKINPAATGNAQLVFSTYLGGNGKDLPAGIAIGQGSTVVIGGTTSSSNFPAANGFQTAPLSAGNHVFVTELDSSGAGPLYSTYLSSSGTDTASGLALDANGNAYVLGITSATAGDFPTTTNAFQGKALAAQQFFVSKIALSPLLTGTSSLAYSTFFGGGNPSTGVVTGGGIAIDSTNNIYITGGTNFINTQNNGQNNTLGTGNDFPILNAAQVCLDTPINPSSGCPSTGVTATDAFIAKINPSAPVGAQLIYSTYIGGSGADVGYGIAVDTGGIAYITGSTTSTNIPLPTGTTPLQNCLDTFPNPNPITCNTSLTGMDAFLAKFTNPALITGQATPTSLLYFSYLGGSGDDVGTAIAVDATGGADITGWTKSADFPVQNALQRTFGGGTTDAFLAHLDTTAGITNIAQVDASSYLGGSGNDAGTSIVLDPFGNVNLTGETSSPNFSTTNPLQANLKGPSDVFITSLAPVINLSVTETASPTPVGVGNQVSFSYTIANNGSDFVSGINFTDIFNNSNPTFASATAPGGCSNASSATTGTSGIVTVTCAVGALSPGTSTIITVNMTPNVAGTFSDNGTVSVFGHSQTFKPTAPATASVNDFTLSVAPATTTVIAGVPATFQIIVGANGVFPSTISLSCSSGLPNPGTCSFIGTNPISNINTGGQVSRSLVINTTARITTTSQLRKKGGVGIFYAASLPLCGLTFLGITFGGFSRRKRLMAILFGAGFFVLVALQIGCGSKGTTTLTTGTPAGTYNVTVSAVSGSVTHTQVVTLVVQ